MSRPVWVSDGKRPSGRQGSEVRVLRAGSDVWRRVLGHPTGARGSARFIVAVPKGLRALRAARLRLPGLGWRPGIWALRRVPRQGATGGGPSSLKLAAGYLEVHALSFFFFFFFSVTKFERKER